ncbi:MAG: phosphate signaling complex protein PhoU [Candidatus Altiarchaeota archaeon]|nr:phosphate signaling complex protein PhoU [Candidatus Altiarchaeota archaeon]
MPRKKLDFQIKTIKDEIEELTDLVAGQVGDSVKALSKLDEKDAKKVIEDDKKANELYTEIKERCIQTIALQQPVAKDLRFISISMDVATNLERIGDYAADIAKNVGYILSESPHISEEFNHKVLKLIDGEKNGENLVTGMSKAAMEMVKKAGRAFISQDPEKLKEIEGLEEAVDEYFRRIFRRLEHISRTDAEGVSFALNMILTARYLERIGDHSMNIASRTMYAMKGREEFI